MIGALLIFTTSLLVKIVVHYDNKKVKHSKLDIYMMMSKVRINYKIPLYILNNPDFFQVMYIFFNLTSSYIIYNDYITVNGHKYKINYINRLSNFYMEKIIYLSESKFIYIGHNNHTTLIYDEL